MMLVYKDYALSTCHCHLVVAMETLSTMEQIQYQSEARRWFTIAKFWR